MTLDAMDAAMEGIVPQVAAQRVLSPATFRCAKHAPSHEERWRKRDRDHTRVRIPFGVTTDVDERHTARAGYVAHESIPLEVGIASSWDSS